MLCFSPFDQETLQCLTNHISKLEKNSSSLNDRLRNGFSLIYKLSNSSICIEWLKKSVHMIELSLSSNMVINGTNSKRLIIFPSEVSDNSSDLS